MSSETGSHRTRSIPTSTTQQSIDIDLLVSTAYNQWTQFEDFPQFMEGVGSVARLDEKRLHWLAEIAGTREDRDAEILEQEPDWRIAWRAITGTTNDGVVSFERLGPPVFNPSRPKPRRRAERA